MLGKEETKPSNNN